MSKINPIAQEATQIHQAMSEAERANHVERNQHSRDRVATKQSAIVLRSQRSASTQELLDRVERPRKTDRGWVGPYPPYDDRMPSPSIWPIRLQRQLECFTECSWQGITAAHDSELSMLCIGNK